ncbi:AAA domain-containing protein [Acholeplasma laidlawii]|uniref:AAA domain-containing protein n=1 Tax=Acholeplasma laidlawii TaxID=2148 RepID=UPI00084C8A6A|nr:AAA domain-containing protein [Acholeplasma laidlawii]OED58995.1 hypothetical protein BHS12_05485 [Acholeplasma laidlawii]
MEHIGKTLSRSIKESKWVAINYTNADDKKTFFWCCIRDIDVDNKYLYIDAFNQTKLENDNNGVDKRTILFDRIQSAYIVEGTTYDVPEDLIDKIESQLDRLKWLEFDLYDEKMFLYYKDCLIYDQPPYQRESVLVYGIDQNILKTNGTVKLNYQQIGIISDQLSKISSQMENNNLTIIDLIINDLSIITPRGKYVIAYKKLNFNPYSKSLVMEDEVHFNYSFIMDEKEINIHNLRNYLDIEVEVFTELYTTNINEAKNILQDNIRKGEKLDDTPYIMDQIRQLSINVQEQFKYISILMAKKEGNTPLQAFFGNMSKHRLGKKDDYQIVTLDNKVNISQLRVISNALKHPITYVQGPPGTGKTHSIINLLISTLFNEQTVLVSSNNNKPIDDIYAKLINLKYGTKTIPLPVLRLGNRDRVLEAIERIKAIYDGYKEQFDRPNESQLNSKKNLSQSNFSIINNLIKDYEYKLQLKEQMDSLDSVIEAFKSNLRVSTITAEYEKYKKDYDSLPDIEVDSIQKHIQKVDRDFLMWLYYTSLNSFSKLFKEPKYNDLISIIKDENEQKRVNEFNRYIANQDNLKDLIKIFPIIMTTNISAARLGNPEPSFDLSIIDEAGQCSIGYALFPISRAKKLLLVGDLNQLRPVITLSHALNKKLMIKYKIPDVYNYLNNSILGLMQLVDYISPFVLLNYHYRSHKSIINFSNQKYYKNELKIETAINDTKALFLADVAGNSTNKTNSQKNTSEMEAIQIAEYIKKRGNFNVGVITPFVNQSELIKNILNEYDLKHVEVGTIHTFQGDEKDTIYFSSAITSSTKQGTFDWIKNNVELINVATTRPKKELIIVGDAEEIRSRSLGQSNDLVELVEYVANNGEKFELTPKNELMTVNSHNYQQYNTKAETELFETIKHYLTTADQYEIKTQVKVANVLNKFTHPVLFDYGTKAVFDFVLYIKRGRNLIPVLVIELNGPEHDSSEETKWRDSKKEQICKDNNIKLLKIGNDYSRRYMFVRESIINILK